ncbi:MAG TPA: hypothetical protein VNT50_06365 [Microbacterium sp.]|uniref:hypothetical protein n=1 Tax=Microbacterium sp. TaxID=51671 RepID=UPI002B854C54|nr:hypothetical protein [Microbacterium sp.]HWI31093.1 hypothetical protein [Microbacterium sp.]
METSDVIALLALIVSGVLGGLALLRSRSADERSKRANEISAQALEAQRLALPPAWGPLYLVGTKRIGLTNTSGRHIIVERLAVEPPEMSRTVRVSSLPVRIEYGDDLALRYFAPEHASPQLLIVTWRYEDEATERTTERRF